MSELTLVALICAFVLAAIFALTLAAQRGRLYLGERDVFRPTVIVPAVMAVTTVPYLLLVAVRPEAIPNAVIASLEGKSLSIALMKYAAIQAVFFGCVFMGLKVRVFDRVARRLPVVRDAASRRGHVLTAALLFVLGAFAYGAFVMGQGAGGGFTENVSYVVENLENRVDMLSGNRAFSVSMLALTIGSLVAVSYLKWNREPLTWCWVAVLLLAAILMLSTFGARKYSVVVLVFSVFVYHYTVRRFARFPYVPVLVLVLLLVPYFTFMVRLRTGGRDGGQFMADGRISSEIVTQLAQFVQYTSYSYTYLFVTNHFTTENAWWGRSYATLPMVIVPRAIYPNKPPLDEGVYIRSIAEGMDVVPPAPYVSLYRSSWPPETLGIMYANFLLPGIMVGGLILGMCYRSCYLYVIRSRYSVFSVMAYCTAIFFFQLSMGRAIVFGVSMLWLGLLLFSVRALAEFWALEGGRGARGVPYRAPRGGGWGRGRLPRRERRDS